MQVKSVFNPTLHDATVSATTGESIQLYADMSITSAGKGVITEAPIKAKVSRYNNEANGLHWYKCELTNGITQQIVYFADSDTLKVEHVKEDTVIELTIEEQLELLKAQVDSLTELVAQQAKTIVHIQALFNHKAQSMNTEKELLYKAGGTLTVTALDSEVHSTVTPDTSQEGMILNEMLNGGNDAK